MGSATPPGTPFQFIYNPATPLPLPPGTRLGPYEIVSLLGSGGMGEVHRARDTRPAMARDVAIKILAGAAVDAESRRRFEQEARATSALNHPHLLAIYDVGVHDGRLYLVEELLEGRTLREVLASGPVPPRRAVDYARANFFVTSQTSVTGNLSGLAGADATCQRLATAAGHGSRTWRAYLSAERDPANGNQVAHARDRIGSGPWYNAALGLVASNVAELHARSGDAAVFLDERGQRINGQWTGSPTPNQHDILTGSNADGTVATGQTCNDWTSDAASVTAQVGHADGLGPNQSTAGALVVECGARGAELR